MSPSRQNAGTARRSTLPARESPPSVRWPGRLAVLVLPALSIFAGARSFAAAAALPPARQEARAPAMSDAERIEQALQSLRTGKDIEANLARLRDAIENSGDPGTLAKQLGTVLLADGRYAMASDFLAEARARLPKDGNVALQLGKAQALLRRFDEAVASLTAADQLMPPGPHPIVKQFLATALAGQQRFDDAERTAIEARREAEAFNAALPAGRAPLQLADFEFTRANVLHIAVRFDAALAVLAALEAQPLDVADRAKAALLRAKILDARGDDAGALAAYAAARAAAPDDVEACYENASFLVRRAKHAEAKALLEQVVARDPQHEGAWFNLARTLPRVGDATGGKAAMARYQEIHDRKLKDDERLTELRRALAAKR
jgi:tetratricopeptide (TPR) repeat protein